jgi:hypothetical protein
MVPFKRLDMSTIQWQEDHQNEDLKLRLMKSCNQESLEQRETTLLTMDLL